MNVLNARVVGLAQERFYCLRRAAPVHLDEEEVEQY